jgi:hypothetical protein
VSVLVALVAGFVLGTRSKGEEWEEVRRSLVALYGSDEFADVVSATRTQMAKSLRMLAQMIDAEPESVAPDGDVVARVRHLIAHD